MLILLKLSPVTVLYVWKNPTEILKFSEIKQKHNTVNITFQEIVQLFDFLHAVLWHSQCQTCFAYD